MKLTGKISLKKNLKVSAIIMNSLLLMASQINFLQHMLAGREGFILAEI
jgi:hypothetical protein